MYLYKYIFPTLHEFNRVDHFGGAKCTIFIILKKFSGMYLIKKNHQKLNFIFKRILRRFMAI